MKKLIIDVGLKPEEPMMDWDREKSSVTDEDGNVVGYIDMNDGMKIHIWAYEVGKEAWRKANPSSACRSARNRGSRRSQPMRHYGPECGARWQNAEEKPSTKGVPLRDLIGDPNFDPKGDDELSV